MIFKKSDLIVHAAMFFLVCFAHESSKEAHALASPIADKTEVRNILSLDVQAPIAHMPIEELPFIAHVNARVVANPNTIVSPKFDRP